MSDLISKSALLASTDKEEIHKYEIALFPTIDAVPVVRCKECKHRPIVVGEDKYRLNLKFLDDVCPCSCYDPWYSWMPNDNWFCKDGERSE